MAIAFVKMHGLGNDYVYLDAVARPDLDRREDLSALARAMSDRHRGIGSDGLILVAWPTAAGLEAGAHVRMRMFNSDGSESEMCGNGVRCVAKFAHDRLGFRARPLRVETGRGVLTMAYETTGAPPRVTQATVDMGAPILNLADVPVNMAHAKSGRTTGEIVLNATSAATSAAGIVTHPNTDDDDRALPLPVECWPVSMGNPHATIIVHDQTPATRLANAAKSLGPRIEHHPAFPRRVNAHWMLVKNRTHAIVHTWERGAGATQACGTGACAALVAGVRAGMLDRAATLTLPGGDLHVRWDDATGHVFMTGPATDVCEGTWPEASDPDAIVPVFRCPQPILTTERLVLRPMRYDDAPAVASLAGDKRVYQYTLLIPHPYLPEHATSWIASHARAWESGAGVTFAITLRETGQLIGAIGLTGLSSRHRLAEMGYWVGVPFWGKGYATEAARATIACAFETLGLHRVYAYYFPGNEASGRVLEKAGMTREGVAREDRFKEGRPRDSVLFGIVAANHDRS